MLAALATFALAAHVPTPPIDDLVVVASSRMALLGKKRLAVLAEKLDKNTTVQQIMAMNSILGVNTVRGPFSSDASTAASMCRVKSKRDWSFVANQTSSGADHGLHCNMAEEWFFFVGTFDTGDAVVGYELMFSFETLVADKCTCEFDHEGTPKQAGGARLTDPGGRLLDVQFAVTVGPKLPNGSATSSHAVHRQASLGRWWTGLAEDEATNAPWGFRVGSYSFDSIDTDLNQLHVRGMDEATGISVDLELARTRPPMLQGAAGFLGNPSAGNAQGYYSFVGMHSNGTISAGGRSYHIVGGYSWMDHQFGSIGVPTDFKDAEEVYALYALAGVNINPVNLGFGVPG